MSRELNRSNSDLCTIELIATNTALSPIERMELIRRVSEGWQNAVGSMPAVHGARRTLKTRNHLGRVSSAGVGRVGGNMEEGL